MPDSFFKLIPKDKFFDSAKVMRAVPDATRRALSKAGAFIYTKSRQLTGRKSKKSAAPGQPPKKHAGQLHDLIYFSFDESRKVVDVGPVKFGQGQAPGLNEFGGTGTRRQKKGPPRTLHYSAHPFMAPALAEADEKGVILDAWKDVVKGNG